MEDLLQDLLDQVEGAFAAAIATLDGLLVEGARRKRVDLEAAVAEHAALLRQAKAAYAGSLGTPRVHELLVGGHPVVGYAHMVRGSRPRPRANLQKGKDLAVKAASRGEQCLEELFLLLLMGPEANLGQARLQTAKAATKLAEVAGWLT